MRGSKWIALFAVAALVLFPAAVMAEPTINWWHAHGGRLGEKVNAIAEGFNQSQSKYQVVATYKGNYADTMTAGIAAFRAKNPPAHPAGLRGGHRHHDGRQGRDQTGLRSDGRIGAAVRSERLPPHRHRLLHHPRRPDALDAVQQFDAGALLQQGCFPQGRPRSGQAARNLARGRRVCPQTRARRAIRPDFPPPGYPGSRSRISAPGTTCPSGPRPTASKAWTPNSSSTAPCMCKPHSAAGRLAERQDLRLRWPAQPGQRQIFFRGSRHVHRILGRLCRVQKHLQVRVRHRHAPLLAGCRRGPPEHHHRRRQPVGDGRSHSGRVRGRGHLLQLPVLARGAGRLAPVHRIPADHHRRLST